MITAVDTNVLLDLFAQDARFAVQSEERLAAARARGAILVCDVVYAELAPSFATRARLDAALRQVRAELSPIDSAIAWEAGRRWGQYRRSGGSRERIMPDFLIGAHAVASADAFLTRDRGFFAAYFPELAAAS